METLSQGFKSLRVYQEKTLTEIKNEYRIFLKHANLMKYILCFLFLIAGFVLGAKTQIEQKIEEKVRFFFAKKPTIKHYPVTEHKPFVFIIPSYNNQEWVDKNLRSIFEQKYDNYRIIYIDDASNDDTLHRAKALVAQYKQEHRVQIVHNETNRGAAENIYRAGRSCADREIIVLCDGDDWLSHDAVLQRLNEIYADENIWATYGSYIDYPSYSNAESKYARPLPPQVIAKDSVRMFSKEQWSLSHIRSFYAALFKQIKLQDLLYEGKYLDTASDVAFMVPIAEMAADHLHFVNDVLYIYNRASALNDHKLRIKRQSLMRQHILSLPAYPRISTLFSQKADYLIDLIAFSFDRPMQLYALLESLELYGKNLNTITVLYRTSSQEYELGYSLVKQAFAHVKFINESDKKDKDFKTLLMDILDKSQASYITCAVDDIILTEQIDFSFGAKMVENTGAYCFSYRLGKHVDYCYMLDQFQGIPAFAQVDEDVLAWDFCREKGDWGYLNSLDLTLYRKEQVCKIWNSLKFTNPNSLETQWFLKGKKKGLGLCHSKAKMVNIPLNLVNISNNRNMHSYSKEELLNKFFSGLKIDILPLQGFLNHSAHVEYDIQFIPREAHEKKI